MGHGPGARSPQNAEWGGGESVGSNIHRFPDATCMMYRQLLRCIHRYYKCMISIPGDLRYQLHWWCGKKNEKRIYLGAVYVKFWGVYQVPPFYFKDNVEVWESCLIVCCHTGVGSWRGRRWRVSDRRSVSHQSILAEGPGTVGVQECLCMSCMVSHHLILYWKLRNRQRA